jgi:hypothetical protein
MRPINIQSQKFIKKASYRVFTKSLLTTENDPRYQDLSLHPEKSRPRDSEAPNVEKATIAKVPSRSEITVKKEPDVSQQHQKSRLDLSSQKRERRKSVHSSEQAPNYPAISSLASVNKDSIFSGSTALPLARLKDKVGQLTGPRPSLKPELWVSKNEGKDAVSGISKLQMLEDSFADQFRRTRQSLKYNGPKLPIRRERIHNCRSRISSSQRQSSSRSLGKAKDLELGYDEMIEAHPVTTEAVATYAPTSRYFKSCSQNQ